MASYLSNIILLCVANRASSVLQKNGKLYGAINALNESDTTCWNSDGGESQYYQINFGSPVKIQKIKMQFQAGFSSEIIKVFADGSELDEEIEPEDALEMQEFDVSECTCQILKLEFEEFTDFYGRITIYKIQVWGEEMAWW